LPVKFDLLKVVNLFEVKNFMVELGFRGLNHLAK